MIEALLAVGALTIGLFWVRAKNLSRPVELPLPAGEPEDREEAIRRVLKHLQRKKIGELVEGEGAVVVGRVVAIERAGHVTSLATATPCLGYAVEVTVHDGSLASRFTSHRSAAVDFVLADETGQLVVRARALELACSAAPRRPWDPPWPPWLVHWLPWLARMPWAQVRIKEGHLHAGAALVVCGVAASEHGAESYRGLSSRLALVGNESFPLVGSFDEDLFEPSDRPVAPEELAAADRRGW